MDKKWTQSELTRIYRDHPELKKVPVMPIDEIVVEFLKLHDVEARPPKNTSRRDGAIAGAITGMAGADVGGDAFLIQGQAKQTQQQEWTSWKQWALSHKDYPDFKKKLTGEATSKNKSIDEKLYEPEFVAKWETYFTKLNKEKQLQQKKAGKFRAFAFLVLVGIVGAVVGIKNSPEAQKVKIEEGKTFLEARADNLKKCEYLQNIRFSNLKAKPFFMTECEKVVSDIYGGECSEFAGDVLKTDSKIWYSRWDKCALNKLSGLFED